jgi:hypothetical protein
MGGWEFAKAMVDMSQWLQSTGCRLNNPMLSDSIKGSLALWDARTNVTGRFNTTKVLGLLCP